MEIWNIRIVIAGGNVLSGSGFFPDGAGAYVCKIETHLSKREGEKGTAYRMNMWFYIPGNGRKLILGLERLVLAWRACDVLEIF
jgi:hypothetical protein